jgi:hypothetical protein
MRKELKYSMINAQQKVLWLSSQSFALAYELERHLEETAAVYSRCPRKELDDTCDAVLIRNPAAKPGQYILSGAESDG